MDLEGFLGICYCFFGEASGVCRFFSFERCFGGELTASLGGLHPQFMAVQYSVLMMILSLVQGGAPPSYIWVIIPVTSSIYHL